MATATVPFPASPSVFYPTTATYPPPIFPGGHYDPYLPHSHRAPPVPYAATHPYQHPDPAYAPPSCFFPAPPFGYPPATVFFPAPEYGHATFPPVATPYPPVSDSIFSGAATHSTAITPVPTREHFQLQSRHHMPHPLPPRSTSSDPSVPSPGVDLSSAGYSFHRPASRMQPDHASVTIGDHAPLLNLQDGKADAVQRHATDLCLDRLPSSTTNKNNAVVPAHTPFDNSPEVTTVTSSTPLSSFARSSGSTKTASTTSSLLSSVPSVFSVSASNVPSTAEYVAPQVFGEMPTPISGQETLGTASDHRSGHHNLIQRSCVSNLSEHSLDGMPQQYGFHNLNRQSVFLADGTDRSYFALPENYPLEQVTPEPVFDVYGDETEDCSNACVDVSASTPGPLFSNESADVFTSTPDQQLYEEEQPETEHSSPCLNVSSDVRDFTLEVQQDNEKTLVNVRQLKAPPLNMLLTEKREEWDPGILNTTIDGHQVVKWSSLEGLKHEVIFSPDILLSMIVYAAIQGEISRLSEGIALLVTYVGINEQSSTNKNCLFATPLLSASDLSIAVYDILEDRTACRSRLHPTVDTIEVDIEEVVVKSSQANPTLCVHEAIVHCHDDRPGHINWTNSLETIQLNLEQEDIRISGAVSNVVNSEAWEFVALWLNHAKLPVQWDPGIGTLSSINLYLQVLTPRIATEKSLSWFPIPELTKWQNLVSNVSFVWDPGTMLLQYRILFTEEKEMVTLVTEQGSFRFNAMPYLKIFEKCIAMSSQLYWHEHNNFNGIALWLFRFQPP